MKYTVFVKPGSRKGPLVEIDNEGQCVVYLRERAVDGKANQALVKLLADHFGVSKGSIKIVHGHASRHKILEIIAK